MLRGGSRLEMYSMVSNSWRAQVESSSIFQYRSPGSLALAIAGQRKQIPKFTPAFQLQQNCQIILWNSQSPRSSTTWNWCRWCVIHVPARCVSAAERGLLPGLLVGLMPWYNQFSDHTSHLKMVLVVLFLYKRLASQLHSKNREYRIDRGLKIGMFIQKQSCFSMRTFVINWAASP